MTSRIFVLPTQNDIIDFRLGNRPDNILVRDFASAAELQAYANAIESGGDEYERFEQIEVVGNKVVYRRRSDDPEIESLMQAVEVAFATPAEAQAFRRGIDDAEGLAAPLLIDDSDDRFEQLLEWTGACPAL